jgi:DNA-binding transcriptional MerR regulator
VSFDEAKLLLSQAETQSDRRNAVAKALATGMPLHEIEEFLDWVDATRANLGSVPVGERESLIGAVLRRLQQKPEVQ